MLNELESAIDEIDTYVKAFSERITEEDRTLFREYNRLARQGYPITDVFRDPDVSWFLNLPKEKQASEAKKMTPGRRAYLLNHCLIALRMSSNLLSCANNTLLEKRHKTLEAALVDNARTFCAVLFSGRTD
jgi:hypothetical protein